MRVRKQSVKVALRAAGRGERRERADEERPFLQDGRGERRDNSTVGGGRGGGGGTKKRDTPSRRGVS